MQRWRIWRGNPNSDARLALVAVAGAFVAGAAGRGDSSLFNILGLICCALAGWYDGRYANAVGEFWPAAVRRGAVVRAGIGFALLTVGWWAPEITEAGSDGLREALFAGMLFGGAALILGAFARFAMTDLMRYAGRKLQERLDDDF
ncbi:MAG: hypothetical protein R2845_01795 [Thermomicrobiales bacterium]